MLKWNLGVEYWSGVLAWSVGVKSSHGFWHGVLSGVLAWCVEVESWHGMLEWSFGIVCLHGVMEGSLGIES
jgi:hypothetical protein